MKHVKITVLGKTVSKEIEGYYMVAIGKTTFLKVKNIDDINTEYTISSNCDLCYIKELSQGNNTNNNYLGLPIELVALNNGSTTISEDEYYAYTCITNDTEVDCIQTHSRLIETFQVPTAVNLFDDGDIVSNHTLCMNGVVVGTISKETDDTVVITTQPNVTMLTTTETFLVNDIDDIKVTIEKDR